MGGVASSVAIGAGLPPLGVGGDLELPALGRKGGIAGRTPRVGESRTLPVWAGSGVEALLAFAGGFPDGV